MPHPTSYIFQFRWRFYTAWTVIEVAGLLAGFALPTNVDVCGCELSTSPSGLIAGWNTSVQGWLKM